MPDLPLRDIRDPQALRAFAHPLRLRILEAVALGGPLTATEVAERVGESPANCSWHLRQLARYGFVEEAGGGTGRARPWRIVLEGHQWGAGEEEPELARAGDAAADVLLDLEYRALREWLAVRRQEEPAWRDAGFFNQSMGWCTPEEVTALQTEIRELFARYLPRLTDPDSRPPGARPVRLMAWGVPAVGHGPAAPDPH
ncbi:helix-turn-helix domain-containing protein [Micromonospora sp. NPDC049679]|uniref:winged helix-turn-helix domain-containing protein n=1 Tax=Micromonospora sp. NPDC049679 TaxID=3155920 RepID=UPI0033E5B8E8